MRKQLRLLTPLILMYGAILILILVAGTVAVTIPPNRSSWYTRYPFYPPYCSTPQQMTQRSIPPLQKDSRIEESRLVHVTVVIRHGARTPLPSHECWDGYWEQPETGVWNCDLTSAESYHHVDASQLEHSETAGHGFQPLFLVEKRYDALRQPQSNWLNGTCQVGQLLQKGYEQGLELGRQLRKAYLYDGRGDDGKHDKRMRLFDLNCTDPFPYEHSSLRLRSDDNQRTIMTAQALFTGMLGDTFRGQADLARVHQLVSIHTADRSRDVLSKNTKLCPQLDQLKKEGEAALEYQAFNVSSEAQLLRNLMTEKLGRVMSNPSDCLMTAICNDRPLPDAVNDYRGEGESNDTNSDTTDLDREFGKNRFRRLVDFRTKLNLLYIKHNNAAFAKLATSTT